MMQNPHPHDIRRASRIFKALAHPDRLRLACRLSHADPTTQKALIEEFGWPQSTMARHIGQLRGRGLIEATRHGTEIKLELAGSVTQDLMAAMCNWVHPETGEHFTVGYGKTTEVEVR